MGRPGLDPLGAILNHSGPLLNVQICWSATLGRSPTFAEAIPSLTAWLDEWLDISHYAGLANVRFKTSDDKIVNLRFGVD
jgi:hypothetical protein